MTIPSSVKSIDSVAFWYCRNLESVIFQPGSKLETIKSGAFRNCEALKEIALPEGLKTIESFAFSQCEELTNIHIPKSLTSIGDGAFGHCPKLQTLTAEEENPVYVAVGNCLINSQTQTLILGTYNSVIPDDGSVKLIGPYAFSGRENISAITIPQSVKIIQRYAFYGCTGLTSIHIPDSVTSVNEGAFSYCSNLKSVIFGENSNLVNIGSTAFSSCASLTDIVIPASVKTIAESAFLNCNSLSTVYFGGNEADWQALASDGVSLNNATVYYYSEVQPAETGNYWHYVDGVPAPWNS